MSSATVAGHYLLTPHGRIFLLVRRPSSVQGCVLVVPPFAEEMNKSRRLVTDLTLQLSSRGYAALIPDLYGTGDSGGDFSEGRWTWWQEDLAAVCAWGAEQGCAVTQILAIRLGALLAVSAASKGQIPAVAHTILWNPVLDGTRHLTQFLRLRTAATLMRDDRAENVSGLRARLRAGEMLEVAGYPLSPALAADLDTEQCPTSSPASLGSVLWMLVTRDLSASVPADCAGFVERSRQSGVELTVSAIDGEPFWASTEIVRNPELVQATVAAFTQ